MAGKAESGQRTAESARRFGLPAFLRSAFRSNMGGKVAKGEEEYEEILKNPDRQGDGDDVGNGAEGVPSDQPPDQEAPDRSYGGGAPARRGGGGGAVPEPPRSDDR